MTGELRPAYHAPGPIRVHIAEVWQAAAVDIYVVAGRPIDHLLLWHDGVDRGLPAGYYWAPFSEGDLPPVRLDAPPFGQESPVTIRLPEGVLDAIVEARLNNRPADLSAGEALADARQVRDRLLALVELAARSEFHPPGGTP